MEMQDTAVPRDKARPGGKRSVLRLLAFALIELLLAPLSAMGLVGYMVKLKWVNQRRGISGTAYEPLLGRAMAHGIGARPDKSSYRLASVLPALSPRIWNLLMWPTAVAVRISGYKPVLIAGPSTRPATFMNVMNLRNEFFDQTLRDAMARVEQVVILGAGWDTRAYEQLRDWRHPIFEVDMAPTLRAKIAALDEADIDRGHVTFVETDFNQVSWLDALKAQGFDLSLPTYVLWEGVTMYLPEDAVRSSLAHITQLAPGSLVAFDYFAKELIEGERPYRLIGWYVKHAIRLFYAEQFCFGIPMRPQAREAAAAFVASNGLTLGRFEMLGQDGRMSAVYAFALAERGQV